MTRPRTTSEAGTAAPQGRFAASRLRVRKSDIAELQAFVASVGLARGDFPARAGEQAAPDEGGEMPLAEHFHLLRRLTAATRDETFRLSTRPLAPGTTDFVVGALVNQIE